MKRIYTSRSAFDADVRVDRGDFTLQVKDRATGQVQEVKGGSAAFAPIVWEQSGQYLKTSDNRAEAVATNVHPT